MNLQPLISVIVITYNSSDYVLETLESIKAQTYSNIELIITDDCSSDDTVKICERWINKYKKRFVRALLITAKENTGIPANCNRGYRLAKGEWIKGIAGDDILVENSLASFVNTYKSNNLIFIGSCKKFFVNKEGKKFFDKNVIPDKRQLSFYDMGVACQYRYMLFESPVITPAVLIRKKVFDEVGYFDEKYRYIEDYPFWFKCVSLGYKIAFSDVLIVYYRCEHESVTSSKVKVYNKKYFESLYQFRKEKIYPQVAWYDILFWQNEYIQKLKYWVICNVFRNKKNRMSLLFSKLIASLSLRRLYSYFSKNEN